MIVGKAAASVFSEVRYMPQIAFMDQNAWIALARGAWDKANFPNEHRALSTVVERIESGSFIAPLTFANIYETAKINDPVRRAHMALTQATISGGRVFRSRRRIFAETLAAYVAQKHSILRPEPEEHWYLSDVWFEAAGDYSLESYGLNIPAAALTFVRENPSRALFDFLQLNDESVRLESVRQFTAASAELITKIEARRAHTSGETLAVRKRAYGARLIIDELEFILATGRQLGLNWHSVGDLSSTLVRGIATDVPIIRVERELVVRLEDQPRSVTENDLRDMMSFITVLPLVDVVIAEKQFVNLARQSRLGESFGTTLLTSIFDL